MLYCQDLSLALFDRGGGPSIPHLGPLGPLFFIPRMLISRRALRTGNQLPCGLWRGTGLGAAGLTFALPPVSCSGRGRATPVWGMSPLPGGHCCLPAPGSGVNTSHSGETPPKPHVELLPQGLAGGCQAIRLGEPFSTVTSRASHLGGKGWVWRLQRRGSRQGLSASDFDWA